MMSTIANGPPPPALLQAALFDLSQTTSQVVLRRYTRGDLLYRQGEFATALYYITKGRVRTFVITLEGREKTLLIASAGDVLNDVAFYLGCEQQTSAGALDRGVEAYQIGQAGFERLLTAMPDMARFLLGSLAAKTSSLISDITNQSFHDVRSRVQLALIHLAKQHGVITPQGVRIELRITHETIASLVGANRSHVSTCLSALQHDGFYQVIDERIVLAPWVVGQRLPP